jgi:hypothetical protein
MYRGMILASSGVLNDGPATTKHEVARNPAARGNALNYPWIDVRGTMLVDRGGKLVTGGRVSLCTDATLHLLAGMLDQHVTDETGHIVEYQRAWRANRDGFAPMLSNFRERSSNRSHFRACCVLPSLPTAPRWCNVHAGDTDRCNLPYSSPQLIAPAGRGWAQLTGIAMRNRKWSRRDVLKTSTALAAGVLFAEPVRAAASPLQRDAGIARSRPQGGQALVLLRTGIERRGTGGQAFEAKYPGIAVRVERSGAERIFQRIAQEQANGIDAVDVANSTDPADYLDWKSKDWLAPYLPADVAKYFPADQVDPDGGAGAERGNQGALRQNILGAIDSEGGALRSVCPEYLA